MKKHLFILILLFVGFTTNAQNVIFQHGFETPEGNDFETGWTNIPTPGGNAWTREGHYHTDLIAMMHGCGRYARIIYHNSVAHDAWLITPGLSFTQGKMYQISFKLWQGGMPGAEEKVQLKIGKSPTAAGMTTLLFETDDSEEYYNEVIVAEFIADASVNYYIAWHACSPPDGYFIMIDDVLVVEVAGNDLENITKNNYSQIPASQTLPPGKVVNVGAATQTNVKLTAEINGTPVGTSAPLASLAPGATAELTLAPPVYVPEGQNTMVYTITQDQPDITPENNICTFIYKGTKNVYAVDEVEDITFAPPIIHSQMSSFGNIFDIRQPVTLSQVILGYGVDETLDYSISLYAMTGELTTAATPIFTQPVSKTSFGFYYVNLPATPLTQGSYFLCANLPGGGGIGSPQPFIAFDANYDKESYGRNNAGNLTKTGYGGALIRMVMTATDCAAPSNLSVVPGVKWATFYWEGNAPLYKLVINDGTQELIYYSPNNSILIWDLEEYTPYTWSLTAICDATHNSATIAGPPFSTLACNNTATFPMPFFEGFETPYFPPTCWTTYNVGDVPPGWGRSTYPHSGRFSAMHGENIHSPQESWLVSPKISIPSTGNYVLEFWSINDWIEYHRYNGVWVSTTGSDPTTSTFTEIKELTGSEISDTWTKITVPISTAGFAGKDIHIGFKYASNDGNDGDRWLIDDIEISNYDNYIDGELAAIISPNTGEGFTSSEAVKVLIKNNGSNPLTGFSLKLEHNGVEIANETYTGLIPNLSQTEYTFNAKLNLAVLGAHEIKVTLNIAGDFAPENDSKTKKIGSFSSAVVKLYGNKTQGADKPYSKGIVSFMSNNPGNLTIVSDYQPEEPANSLVAGEYVDEYFYAYPAIFTENDGHLPVSFVKISTETWTEVASTPVSTYYPLDMAYDYTTNTMYGIFAPDILGTVLYKIDMETGAMTEIKLLGGLLTNILACSPQGELYTVCTNGDFCSINKTTGETEVIGSTELTPYYKQALAFDRNTGRLFWAMSNTAAESRLFEVDLGSGIVFNRGNIAGNAGIVGLYTILGDIGIPDTKLPATFTIYPNPANNELRITNYELREGVFEIYDVYGRKLSSHTATHSLQTVINISTLSSGVYFIRLTDGKTNSVQRFIKE